MLPLRSSIMAEDFHLAVFDGNNHCLRSGFSPSAKGLATAGGTPTGLIFQSIMSFVALYRQIGFTHCVFAFDSGRSSMRTAIRSTYKSNRDQTKAGIDELKPQFAEFQRFLRIMDIPYVKEYGVEADDLIAGLAWRNRGKKVTIVTADHDLLQLVGGQTTVYNPQIGATPAVWYDTDAVRNKYGLEPRSLAQAWSLMGDIGDGIEGIPKVGPKTAAKLMDRYGTLEGVLTDPRYHRYATLVRENHDLISLDGELFALFIPVSLYTEFTPGYPEELRDFFKEFEMGSLIRQFDNHRIWESSLFQ